MPHKYYYTFLVVAVIPSYYMFVMGPAEAPYDLTLIFHASPICTSYSLLLLGCYNYGQGFNR